MSEIINDYELVYLSNYELSEQAYLVISNKYSKFIYKMIHQLHIPYHLIDDYYQEGLMMLDKAIHTFDEFRYKTFMRYFELILLRHFLRLRKDSFTYVLYDNLDYIVDTTNHMLEGIDHHLEFGSKVEKIIYQKYFVEKQTIDYIVADNGLDKKKVYNALYRIKTKLKKQ